jgi:hypothetical protein
MRRERNELILQLGKRSSVADFCLLIERRHRLGPGHLATASLDLFESDTKLRFRHSPQKERLRRLGGRVERPRTRRTNPNGTDAEEPWARNRRLREAELDAANGRGGS